MQVWERRDSTPRGSRAIGIHAPSLDAFAAIGADVPVLAEATLVRRGIARSRGRTLGTLSFARASDTHPYVATLDQHRTEGILRDRLAVWSPDALQHGDERDRRCTVTRTTSTSRARPRRRTDRAAAGFVVGADGARSTVRDLLGIDTVGLGLPRPLRDGRLRRPRTRVRTLDGGRRPRTATGSWSRSRFPTAAVAT